MTKLRLHYLAENFLKQNFLDKESFREVLGTKKIY